MHLSRLFPAWLFLGLLAGGNGHAVELQLAGITVPFFAVSGRPTHRLIAREGRLDGDRQHLKEVEVVYFSATNPSQVVQRVTAAEATWDAAGQVLTGSGAITVSTEENQLSGNGFDFALATSRVQFRRDFTMTNREVRLTSDRATAELSIESHSDQLKLRDVRRCEAEGHLVVQVQSTAQGKYPFERAASERAIYDGASAQIRLPQETRITSKGIDGVVQHITIDLKPKPAAAAPR